MSKTIDITPTWVSACHIYLMVLENGSEEGKKIARAELLNMAKLAQQFVELDKKVQVLKKTAKG